MQIKPIIVAAGTLACMLSGWTAIAADAPNPASDEKVEQAPGANPVQAPAAKTEQEPQAMSEEQVMPKMEKAMTSKSVRNTRPKISRHKDARACLEAVNNKAIIKCANKYR